MPEWLRTAVQTQGDFSTPTLVVRQVLALAFGAIVAGIYRLTCGRPPSEARSLMATLVLLAVLIGMISSVIGDNVARAFSLVGALSIVRFRTVVEDTRDTAFVIFAVGVGMAAGAGYLIVPVIGIPVAALAAFALRPRAAGAGRADTLAEFLLTIRTGVSFSPADITRGPLERHAVGTRVVSLGTGRSGAVMEAVYAVRLRPDSSAEQLVKALHGVEGVQSVELSRR